MSRATQRLGRAYKKKKTQDWGLQWLGHPIPFGIMPFKTNSNEFLTFFVQNRQTGSTSNYSWLSKLRSSGSPYGSSTGSRRLGSCLERWNQLSKAFSSIVLNQNLQFLQLFAAFWMTFPTFALHMGIAMNSRRYRLIKKMNRIRFSGNPIFKGVSSFTVAKEGLFNTPHTP